MTTICHSNFFLHRMLTEDGACVHTHHPESFEDVGDAESGPQLSGGPAWDEYSSESHCIIVDATGLIVHSEAIDWSWCSWVDQMIMERGDDRDEWPEYVPPRRAGEEWQITVRNEDGRWWLQRGQCWTSDRREAHFFSLFDAKQRIAKAQSGVDLSGMLSGRVILVHEDECPRCLIRKQPEPSTDCNLCGRNLSQIGTPAPKQVKRDDVAFAVQIVRDAEEQLKRKLKHGERRDLLADNEPAWSLQYIDHVLADAAPQLAESAKPKLRPAYQISLAEYQRVLIAQALRLVKEHRPVEYAALASQPGYCFDTLQQELDVLLEMVDELPKIEADNPGVLHGFAI